MAGQIDIKSPSFIEDFRISESVIGQIGYGFIGNAVVELFRPHTKAVLVYDKAGYEGRHRPENTFLCTDIDVVVKLAEVIFVAVPTPMKPSGECHTGIVESVLQDIQNSAIKLGRSIDSFVVVLKSTVPPGFTRKMQDRYALRLLFSPEFLTEANAVRDFKTTGRVLLGGDVEDARIVFKYFEGVWPDRQLNTFVDHPDGPVQIIQCESEEAEMVKLSTNVHLTARVMVSNELYLICERLGVSYDNVKVLTQLDRRIGLSHMDVPGPDGRMAYGGSCFVKDVQSLNFIAQSLGEGNNLFGKLHERCVELRPEKDWELLTGRAILSSDEREEGKQ